MGWRWGVRWCGAVAAEGRKHGSQPGKCCPNMLPKVRQNQYQFKTAAWREAAGGVAVDRPFKLDDMWWRSEHTAVENLPLSTLHIYSHLYSYPYSYSMPGTAVVEGRKSP